MKKTAQRLVIFFVGLPALLSLVLFLPYHNHLFLNLTIVVFSALAGMELRNILSHKNMHISIPEAVILGALSPAAWTLVICFDVTGHIVSGAFALGATWLLVSGIFVKPEKLDLFIGRVAMGFTVMIYPGFFSAWIVKMAALADAAFVIFIFFIMVLLNDSAAWFAGMLFGKGNRGIIAASPNKSGAGFIGGLFASLLTGAIAALVLPSVFTSNIMPSIPAGILLGLFVGAAATLGDLCESAIKRSAGVKDSGSLILGRGGALDSTDSLILAAPVYFVLYRALFDKI
jgi:phosphatidate cytidylyltransferase